MNTKAFNYIFSKIWIYTSVSVTRSCYLCLVPTWQPWFWLSRAMARPHLGQFLQVIHSCPQGMLLSLTVCCVLSHFSCIWLCDPMDCSPPSSYWSRLPFPSPGDLPKPGIEPVSLASPALADRFSSTELPGKPQVSCNRLYFFDCFGSLGAQNQMYGPASYAGIPSSLFCLWLHFYLLLFFFLFFSFLFLITLISLPTLAASLSA